MGNMKLGCFLLLCCLLLVFLLWIFYSLPTFSGYLSSLDDRLKTTDKGFLPYIQDKTKTFINNDTNLKPNIMNASAQVTVVTAFYDIGRFQKGEGMNYFSPQLYHKWMKIFALIQNPVVFYLESGKDIGFIKHIRSYQDPRLTKIIRVSRNESWAFGLQDRIAAIYKSPSYPKHHPNTVVPHYSCAMHAKYETMLRTVLENPFRTKYFSWLDIGYFRHLLGKKDVEPFLLTLPPKFDDTKVAYTQVYAKVNRTARDVFRGNHVWVCGGYFVAEEHVMSRWVQEYKHATEHFLSQGLMNTDQQVIYSMFMEDNFDFRPTVNIQTYRNGGKEDWFYLGFISRK